MTHEGASLTRSLASSDAGFHTGYPAILNDYTEIVIESSDFRQLFRCPIYDMLYYD